MNNERGKACDICHQWHYQISPACERRRKQRAEEDTAIRAVILRDLDRQLTEAERLARGEKK